VRSTGENLTELHAVFRAEPRQQHADASLDGAFAHV
jgi:hypothetical protein